MKSGLLSPSNQNFADLHYIIRLDRVLRLDSFAHEGYDSAMATRSPLSPMEDDESKVEARPRAAQADAKRRIGRMDVENSVSAVGPSPLERGSRQVPPGSIGLRTRARAPAVSEKSVAVRTEVRAKVGQRRDEHRQRVWDKLDEARRRADEKRPRMDRFKPHRDR